MTNSEGRFFCVNPMAESNGLSSDKLLLTTKKKTLCLGAACSNKDLERQCHSPIYTKLSQGDPRVEQ